MYHLPNFRTRSAKSAARAQKIQVTPLQPTTDGANAPCVADVRPSTNGRVRYFALIALAIVLLAILRSSIATRFDSFTADENYHVVAGVSYFRTGDYRINPEHPPLVKLWVGAFIPYSVLKLPPLKIFNDKSGERTYAAETVYLKNDPDRIQRYARFAMFCFNGILLFAFALVARRVFGDAIALGALIFLAIDPTVAAHIPVVMTDLPVTLIGAIALLSAWLAFQSWKPAAVTSAAIALGLTLATKHSGIIFAVFIALFGFYMSLRNVPASPQNHYGLTPTRARRLLLLAALLIGACATLWSTYRFHFHESPTTHETFNRPLADKIIDLESPRDRFIVGNLARFHLFPRPFLWGFADIIRAGVEGRGYPLYFMDTVYIEKKPLYVFPIHILVKTPLGLLVLSAVGVILLFARRIQLEFRPRFWLIAIFSLFFLTTIATSHSHYAGVRHVLPVYPTLALFAGATLAFARTRPAVVEAGLPRRFSSISKTLLPKAAVAASFLWAFASAVPVLRPWEYHNALAGGTSRAYLHFSDEGIDLGLRVKDLAAYYHRVLEPKGELPYYITYLSSDEELRARGIHTLSEKWDSGELPDDSNTISGTIIAEAIMVTPITYGGLDPLRHIEPTERFGNLLVYRGSFDLRANHAIRLFSRAATTLYSPAGGPTKALPQFLQAVELNPELYPAWIDVGNIQAELGQRDLAIHAFEQAILYAPQVPALRDDLTNHLRQLQSAPDPKSVRPLRNPFAE